MLVLAIGTFTDPSKLGPHAEEEMATIAAHKGAGIVVHAYRRADGKGVASSGGWKAWRRLATGSISSCSRGTAS